MLVKFTNFLIVIAGLVILSTSCKKDHGGATPPPTPAPDVYVLGTDGDTAIYWKNGVPTILNNGAPNVYFNSMAVSGTNVYFGGYKESGLTGDTAKYWKNGVITNLPDTTGGGFAYSIFVSGNDVYLAGIQNNANGGESYATYWKDGVPNTLPGNELFGQVGGVITPIYADYTSSIFVAGGDVYVAGGSHVSQVDSVNTYHFARYWKNGVPTELVNGLVEASPWGAINDYPTTTSIFVAGSDVYVAGYEWNSITSTTTAIYWKNGAVSFLTDTLSGSSANSVYVSGSDVYVAGYENINGISYATYWKNGVATNLTTGTGGSEVNSIFVAGSDVYAAGFENINGYSIARYWKNGVATSLTFGSNRANAYSIYVQ